MEMVQEINTFVDAMISSQEQFKGVKQIIDEKQQLTFNCLRYLQERLQRILSSDHDFVSEDEDLSKIGEKIKTELQKLLNATIQDYDSTQKGMKFINDYEDSFNVAIFGKVKSGKSFLGNFIMGNEIRKMGIQTSYNKLKPPKVEVYDRGKHSVQDKLAEMQSEEGNDGFRVDNNEATSAIQMFHLGGLSWFDTPGIGSVTWENEMLAQEYVKNADLVVYASNTDAAGTRQDFEELRKLHEMGKRFVLVLTQSDTLEEDTDDEGDIISVLVAKPEKDRRETEAYMLRTLRENNIQLDANKEILTISTLLAKTALEKNKEELFNDSNLSQFLQILTEITTDEGAKLKLATPKERLMESVNGLKKQLKVMRKTIEEQQREFQQEQKRYLSNNEELKKKIQSECQNKVRLAIHEKTQEVEAEKKTITDKELSQMLSQIIYEVINRNCQNISRGIAEGYKEKLQVDGLGELKMEIDEIEYETMEVDYVERDPEGIIEHFKSLFGKEFYRPDWKTVTKTFQMEKGVNTAKIEGIAMGKLKELFSTELEQMLTDMINLQLAPMNNLFKKMEDCLVQSEKELGTVIC